MTTSFCIVVFLLLVLQAVGPKENAQLSLSRLMPSLAAPLAAMRLRFRATINPRRLVGRTLSSPQVSCFWEALAVR